MKDHRDDEHDDHSDVVIAGCCDEDDDDVDCDVRDDKFFIISY